MRLEQWGTHGPIKHTPTPRMVGGARVTKIKRTGPWGCRLVCSCGHVCLEVEDSTVEEWRERAARGYRMECPECLYSCKLDPGGSDGRLGVKRITGPTNKPTNLPLSHP